MAKLAAIAPADPVELGTPATIGVRVRCPNCGDEGVVPVALASRVTMTEGLPSRVGVRVRAPTLPHLCGQLTIAAAIAEQAGDG